MPEQGVLWEGPAYLPKLLTSPPRRALMLPHQPVEGGQGAVESAGRIVRCRAEFISSHVAVSDFQL